MRKLKLFLPFVFCAVAFSAAVSCENRYDRIKPIEQYKGFVITNVWGGSYNDTQWLTLKSPDTIFNAQILKFDVENKYSVKDTIK